MKLNSRLYDLFSGHAQKVTIKRLNIGIGYTVVETSSGGMGLSYTYFQSKKSCQLTDSYKNYEGRPASELLEKIESKNTIEKSMAIALVNALNYEQALLLPEDRKNQALFEKLDIHEGSRVAMVGYFGPLMKIFKQKRAKLEVIDEFKGIGIKKVFYKKIENWADALFLTSTSILNNTTEEILSYASNKVKTVMLGPTTPMVGEAFDHLPVKMLAGTVPIEKENVLKAVVHGAGTPVIQKFSRKSFLLLSKLKTNQIKKQKI